jgi:VanZ family protein
MNIVRHRLLDEAPVILWAALIYYLSSLPQLSHIPMPYHLDKLAHAIVYGVLAVTAFRALYHQRRFEALKRNAGMLALLFVLLYGVADELHQQFVPGRVSSMLDLAADVAGAAIALRLWQWYVRRRAVSSTN